MTSSLWEMMGFEIQTRNIHVVYPPHPRVPQWAGKVPWSPAPGEGGGGANWEGGKYIGTLIERYVKGAVNLYRYIETPDIKI